MHSLISAAGHITNSQILELALMETNEFLRI